MTTHFETALALIDEVNGEDPNLIETASGSRPAELLYGERMSAMLVRFHPDASEELRLAVRAQHLRRWARPRTDYPMDRKGYHAWRNAAKKAHAEEVAGLLSRAGYDEDAISRVQSLIRKERLKRDPEAQTLEDVACLVFLEHYFSAFATKHEHEKLIGILRKTWAKMSETAREAALKLPMDKSSSALVQEAVSG